MDDAGNTHSASRQLPNELSFGRLPRSWSAAHILFESHARDEFAQIM
jgi:hypothetical protein